MLMIVDAFANMEPKNLVMDHINITFVAITICLMILGRVYDFETVELLLAPVMIILPRTRGGAL